MDLTTTEGRHAFYTGRAWYRFRAWVLRQRPLCVTCERRGLVIPAVDLDHIVSLASGGAPLDVENTQGLCRSCHAAKTRSEKTGKPIKGCSADGTPIDQRHPWNKP